MKVLLTLFLTMMILSLSKPSEAVENRPPKLIVAFGDSLTAGYGVAPDEAYPALLGKKLKDEHFSYRVINAGISGDTTTGGLSRIEAVIRKNPDIVILELGANDGLRGTSLSLIRSNLDQIISRLKKKRIKIVLAGMKLPPNYGPEYTNEFYQIYLSLAKEHKIPLIPFFLEGTAVQEKYNQGDGIHPTAEGYKIVTANLWPYLVPLLSK
ncbi:MAG: arylesterase [Nitrospirae bacterium]|nr:arylesterase [Nitrospirota bacterium]